MGDRSGARDGGDAGKYHYDEELVQLLQKKIAAQEREMSKLREEVQHAAVADRIMGDGNVPPATLEKAKRVDRSQQRRMNPMLQGIYDADIERRYGVEYAMKHGIGIGAGSLGMAGPPDTDVPAEHHARVGILNSRSVLLSDSN